jgi:hypothetical protein
MRTRRELEPGHSVPVLYDPAQPAHAKWDSTRIWEFPATITALAVLAFAAALFPDVMYRPLR